MTASLFVAERGTGDAVVLLHSGGMSSRQWKKLTEQLAPAHRVLAPDFLGSGENPAWDLSVPFHFHRDVDAIEALVEGLGAPAHVVGHSYGGLVALTLARRRPDLVRTLSLYDPVAFGVLYASGDVEGLADLARVHDHPVFTDHERGGGDAWFEVFVDYWNGPGSWRAMPPPARDAFLRVGRKVFLEVESLMGDQTHVSAYDAVTAPVLAMAGSSSPPAARRVVELIVAAKPTHRRLVVVDGAGHMGPITHASAVNEAVSSHIRNQR